MSDEEEVVVVRWPCAHGNHYSHYDRTDVKPYTKCEDQRNVTLRQFDSGWDPGDAWNGEIDAWVEVPDD